MVVGFLEGHVKLMASKECGTVTRWPNHPGNPSTAVGASCWAYLAPSIAIVHRMSRPTVMAAAWVCQANMSFMADYVYVGKESWWHCADRVGATALFIQQAVVAGRAIFIDGCPRNVAGPFLALAGTASLFLDNARTTDDFERFEISQVMWHVLGVGAVVLGVRRFK